MKYNPDIIKSDRKTISIEIRPDGKMTIRVPRQMTYKEIEKYVNEKSEWIEKTLKKCKPNENDAVEPYTEEEIKEMNKRAKEIIPPKVEYYSKIMGVTYEKITIRHPKTRWGSCSSKGSLNFNCLLVLFPEEIMDSVIVHELAHRKEMNHSKRFYEVILKVMPEYHEYEKWLKAHGFEVLRRL